MQHSAAVPVEPLESSDTFEPRLWASMAAVPPVRTGGADIVNNTQLREHSTEPAPALRSALHGQWSLVSFLVGARDGSPSVELGERLRLCEHFERSGRR